MMGRKRRKNPHSRGKKSKTIKVLILISIFSAVITILMISEGVVSANQGSIGLVIILSLIFLFLGRDRAGTPSKRRSPPRKILPTNNTPTPTSNSSGGLKIEATSSNPETPAVPITTQKPQFVRAARRKREYISYPINLDGGSYADTYLQLTKDTVLKLRSALWDGKGTLPLPGKSIPSFQIAKEETTTPAPSQESVSVTEPLSATASPVIPTITPASAEPEVETDSSFDFEWE